MELSEFLNEWNNSSDCLLVHTSGSTGKPKPMMVEKEKMLNSARITCDFLGLKPGDTALLCMSLDYIAGKMMVVRSIERHLQLVSVKPSGHPLSDESLAHSLLMDFASDGKKASEHDVTDIESLGHDVGDICFNFVAMVPMQVYNSLQVPEERERLSHIKNLIIGGGAIDDALASELREMSEEFRKKNGYENAIWSTYGMTETLSHIALRRLNGKEASDWYQPFDSVRIGTNEEGCLVIDAPLVCEKQLVTNDIVEIKEKFTPSETHGHGICLCPDSGHQFLFRIKGRKDNVICSGGIKIQIEEVEDKLRPYLLAPFMLAKKKDEKFGEIAVLITESQDLQGVEHICREILPKYWIPKEYLHFDHLPLTETGKPKRSILMGKC